MKSGFIDKLIDRLDRVDPEEVQRAVLKIVQEKGFLENVFDALHDGVIVTGLKGRIHYINRAACGFFGLKRNESIGTPVADCLPGLQWDSLTKSGRVVNRDLEIFYPEPRFLNFYITPLEAKDEDEPEGYVLILRDTTRSRKMQAEEIESEKVNALTMLAAGVAHEIGNPLNSLHIHLQVLERKLRKQAEPALANELSESLAIAQGEIKRLDFIVEKFLTAVRPTEPSLEVTDLNEVVRESVEFLAPEIQDRGIDTTLQLHADLPALRLDRDQFKQAFYNLIRNAGQAIGSGGEITIRTDCDDFNVIVSFSDTGSGIAAEQVGDVFEPYFTTKKTGSGLGLLIVHRIIREHGGEIEFESEEGDGTTVRIYLPRVEKRMRLLE
ncbi:MAG: PAS domain-containing protein, partial [Verrucomicrobiales bacterium]|nr:PAS domain-containing protein [Verrucomicrobiales bacterium]